MKPTSNDKLIAYLVLFSGLAISGVAEYYSIMGLMAIYPAALIPIVIMGVVLGIGKISATVWLKQNWEWSPFFLKAYVLPAIIALMLITSLGVFGFLSKAHSDQSLVSGDVQSKIAVYDEKIKTEKENIDANRKALKQMDEAVDQVMARSTSEGGAEKAVAIRRAQQKERGRLAQDISESQKRIAALNEERAPIATEVRKVEAEVGPIKYIAHLLYGENPDANILEKAVIWVTVLIVIVLDPLAVVLLLASQYSFQRFRELEEDIPAYEPDDGPLTDEQITQIQETVNTVTNTATVVSSIINYQILEDVDEEVDQELDAELAWNKMIAQAEAEIAKEKAEQEPKPEVDQYAYLKKPWVWSVPGATPVGPLVYKPEDDSVDQEVLETEGRRYQIIPELIKEEPTGPKEITVDWESIPADQEYIMIDGQNMHVRAAKSIYKQTPKEDRTKPDLTEVIQPEVKFESYVQNEEQSESGIWNRVISEAEYRDQASAKQHDSKDNPNNPT